MRYSTKTIMSLWTSYTPVVCVVIKKNEPTRLRSLATFNFSDNNIDDNVDNGNNNNDNTLGCLKKEPIFKIVFYFFLNIISFSTWHAKSIDIPIFWNKQT